MEQSFGVWYVRGGIRALADAVYRRCERRGVEFRFDTRVAEVLEKDGRACGVDTAAGRIDADVVVSAMDARVVFSEYLGTAGSQDDWPSSMERLHDAPGRVVVLLALRGERPAGTAHRTVVHAADRAAELDGIFRAGAPLAQRPTVQVLRPDDASLHPMRPRGRGAHRDHMRRWVSTGPDRASPSASPTGWSRRRTRPVWASVSGCSGGWCGRRMDTARETGSFLGSVPLPALAGARGAYLQAPTEEAPGFYLVGGAAHPGGGLARVGMSACIAANLIGPA